MRQENRQDKNRDNIAQFSGGRSSAYLLYHCIHEWHIPIADVIFCNTGKERPETLDFVQRCAEEWDVDITWLEYRYDGTANGTAKDPRHKHVVVTHETASRNGEPFDQLIAAKKYLPNLKHRLCTVDMKIKTSERYLVREKGYQKGEWRELLGIRYDEPRRWQKAMLDDECRVEFPLVVYRRDKKHVMDFWRDQNFDLQLPIHQSNCDLCFLKRSDELLLSIRENPALADWWIDHEDALGQQFHRKYSYRDRREQAFMQPELPLFGTEEAQIDCYCGE